MTVAGHRRGARVRTRFVGAALVLVATVPSTRAGAQPSPPRATLREDLRLDANIEDFSRVRLVFVGPHGEIVIPLLQDAELRVYNAAGKRRSTIGRNGAGPGEFRDIFPLGWKGDTLWVHDPSQRRISYFGPNDTLIRAVPNASFDLGPSGAELARARASGVGIPLSTIDVEAVLSGGDVLGLTRTRPPNPTPAQRVYGGDEYLVRVTPGHPPKRLLLLPWYGDARWSTAVAGYGRSIPFAARPQTVVSETGDRVSHMWSELTSGTGGTFTVSLFTAGGDTLFVRTFPFVGVPIPSSARDSAIEAQIPRRGASEGSPAIYREFQEQARDKMPPVYAGVESLLLGLDNTVWVGLHRTPQGQPVLVLNAKGDPIATILVPPRSVLRQASATHVYMTETDDDGLVSVVRYRVSGIDCGAPGCR